MTRGGDVYRGIWSVAAARCVDRRYGGPLPFPHILGHRILVCGGFDLRAGQQMGFFVSGVTKRAKKSATGFGYKRRCRGLWIQKALPVGLVVYREESR